MAVRLRLPAALASLTDGSTTLELAGQPATAAEALQQAFARHPGLRDRLLDEQGGLRPNVNVFVGPDNLRWSGGLQTALPSDAELTVIPAVSGG